MRSRKKEHCNGHHPIRAVTVEPKYITRTVVFVDRLFLSSLVVVTEGSIRVVSCAVLSVRQKFIESYYNLHNATHTLVTDEIQNRKFMTYNFSW